MMILLENTENEDIVRKYGKILLIRIFWSLQIWRNAVKPNL